jgi:hypothetical protein
MNNLNNAVAAEAQAIFNECVEALGLETVLNILKAHGLGDKISYESVPHVDIAPDGLVIGAKHLRDEITEKTHPGLSHLSRVMENPEAAIGMYLLGSELIPAVNYFKLNQNGFVESVIKAPDDKPRIMALGAQLNNCEKIRIKDAEKIIPFWIDDYGEENGTIYKDGELITINAAVNRQKRMEEKMNRILSTIEENNA